MALGKPYISMFCVYIAICLCIKGKIDSLLVGKEVVVEKRLFL